MPNDLRNLCIVCKELQAVAIAQLYCEFTIHLPTQTGHLLNRSGHFGHYSIRSLIFRHGLWDGSKQQQDTMRAHIKHLLLLLPHNRLKRIDTPALLPLDREIMLLLAATQRNLSHIGLGPLYDTYLALPAVLKPWPSKLRSLEIQGRIGDERDFLSYQEIMENSNCLKDLIFRAFGTETEVDGFMDKMHDTATTDGLISKALRVEAHGRTGSSSKLVLSQPCLHKVGLLYAGRTFIQNIDFGCLRTLDLFQCEGSATLLEVLTSSFRVQGCCMRGFTLSIDNFPASFDSKILVSFLECLNDLEYLTIDLWSLTEPFSLNYISAHARTLARLYINIGSNRGGSEPINPLYVIPLDEIRMLCESFTKLSQLALPLPKINLVRNACEQDIAFTTYLVSSLMTCKANSF